MVGKMMGESIKSAISLKIKSNFSITSENPQFIMHPIIYKEQIVQGMEKPSFFIWQMDVAQEKLMRNNYKRLYQMNVRYHPESNNLNQYEVLADIGNRLLESLATIEVPIFLGRYDTDGEQMADLKSVRGSQMSFRIVDGILQVFVSYAVKTKLVEAAVPFMERLFVNSIGVDIPDSTIIGEYTTGVVSSLSSKQIRIDGNLIPQENINYSLLISESAIWNSLASGDEVVLLRSGNEYFVIDAKDKNRLKSSIDGGEF